MDAATATIAAGIITAAGGIVAALIALMGVLITNRRENPPRSESASIPAQRSTQTLFSVLAIPIVAMGFFFGILLLAVAAFGYFQSSSIVLRIRHLAEQPISDQDVIQFSESLAGMGLIWIGFSVWMMFRFGSKPQPSTPPA